MRGDITLRLLENIRDFTFDSITLLEAFLNAGYGASSGKILREFDKRSAKKEKHKLEKAEAAKLKHRFYSMLNKLERDGLITKLEKSPNKILELTKEGHRKIKQLKEARNSMMPIPNYVCHSHDNFLIVIFDVPEQERKKRNWLRTVLGNLNFTMLQKSVWMGRVKIPKELIDDLRELEMVHYVEIFEISKGGTLRQII